MFTIMLLSTVYKVGRLQIGKYHDQYKGKNPSEGAANKLLLDSNISLHYPPHDKKNKFKWR